MKIFVTRKVPLWEEVGRPLFQAGHEVVVYQQNKRIERGELSEQIGKGYDGLWCLLTDKIDEELLAHDKNRRLKIIANYAVGFDNIDLAACQRRGIMVSNTPAEEVFESVAELTWTLMLALGRRVVEADQFMRNAAYRGWEPEIFLGHDMLGKVLGIVGLGRIGSMVARRAVGFGMRVIYHSRQRIEGVEFDHRQNLEDLLGESDFVTLHVPLTPETTHLINGKNLPLFKKTAFLVNTARGPVVNEAEVVEALRAGMIGGYGADVYENEPDPHPELLQMENVVLTPHIASATWAARRAMGEGAVANLLAGLQGKIPPNLVK